MTSSTAPAHRGVPAPSAADPKPNFFIVGAPKSGTTALAEYLGQHPECFFSSRKELHYFCPDLDYHYRVEDEAHYHAFFADAGEAKAIGEGSVWYLYSPDAARRIRDYNGNARIIVMLRRPPEMLESLHKQYRWNGYETAARFEDALALHPARAVGRDRPLRDIMGPAHAPAGLVYWEACYYARQVRRFLDAFGPERVLVIKYDDFRRDVAGTFARTCSFLGISPEFHADFRKVNERKRIRSRRLGDWLDRPSPATRMAARLVPGRRRIVALLKALNVAKPESELTPRIRREILEWYEDDIRRLEFETGQDFAEWLRVAT